MKTVREVLRELDTEKLLETYVYDHPIEFYKLKVMDLPASEIYRRYKELYREFLERLRTMEIQPMEDGRQGILFVSRYLKDNIDENTYELIFMDELLEKGEKCESYAYEFTPQAEILGFLVADTSRTQDHIYELMADTLHEASFFGFQQEALDEELKRLKEAEKEAEAGLGISHEELMEKLDQEHGWILHRRVVDENSEEVQLRRQAVRACMAYFDFCREQELLQIKEQLEHSVILKPDDLSPAPTEQERQEIEAAAANLPVLDEDCPEMTDEQLSQFKPFTAQFIYTDQRQVMV